ncbi:MAG: VTT domain-containing protein [Acidobacteria bacterium]|nr:VTT domain-containing protein [Acidobacteriota bacterium]
MIQFLSTVVTGWYGYLILFAVVFAETGLLVGFFLPGDSLLFTVGVVAGAGGLDVVTIIVLLSIAAIVGDQVGYMLGKSTGSRIFDRPDSRFFKQDYLRQTQAFYDKHGGKTLIYARFVPIVRTFAPFMAGVAKMPYGRFVAYNIFGGIGWVILMILSGYFLGQFPLVRRHFEKIVIGIVLVSVLPVILEVLRSRKKS